MKIVVYTTSWHDRDNVTLLAMNDCDDVIGTLMIDFHGEDKMDAYLWNLHVMPENRRQGVATRLMDVAEQIAHKRGCKETTLEWDVRDTPHAIFDWYVRRGYEEREFGKGNALMYKKLEKEIKVI